ncbi:hypothetical protein [uncultured Lamprocystis sp.]|jgi:hypothetical protein|uniref:hypothetical protein n=1 Tax=uncultured Lamprocystis sp. TaxID=543132 RepID=UPI0025EF99F8|nr:hypothetical protein [uncultured Lamprocystis sp.]
MQRMIRNKIRDDPSESHDNSKPHRCFPVDKSPQGSHHAFFIVPTLQGGMPFGRSSGRWRHATLERRGY